MIPLARLRNWFSEGMARNVVLLLLLFGIAPCYFQLHGQNFRNHQALLCHDWK
jgi:hypothetical protein